MRGTPRQRIVGDRDVRGAAALVAQGVLEHGERQCGLERARAAHEDQSPARARVGGERLREPRLAEAGLAGDGDHPPAGGALVEEPVEAVEHRHPADDRGREETPGRLSAHRCLPRPGGAGSRTGALSAGSCAGRRRARKTRPGARSPSGTGHHIARRVLVPFTQGALVATVYAEGSEVRQESTDQGTRVRALVPPAAAARITAALNGSAPA